MNKVDEIDLNINNYDINSLITFFGLNDKKMNEIVLEEKKNLIYNVLLNDNKLTSTKKINLFEFINKAYSNLLIYINNNNNPLRNESLMNNSTITDNIDLSNLYSEKKVNDKDYEYTTGDNTNKLTNHPIVTKPYTKFSYSDVSSAFEGIINPLEKRITTKIVCLDTRFRENFCSTNSNNFIIQLSSPLENVISMKLTSFEIPRLWYSISSTLKNNTFVIYLYNMVNYTDNVQTIVIPDGNYNNILLTKLINNYFTNIANGLNYLKFEINMSTSKASFYVKSDPTDAILPYNPTNVHYSPYFHYKIDFLTCEGFGLYLGYSKKIYKADKHPFYVDNFNVTPSVKYYGIIIGESSCGSNLDNYIFIDINDFNKNFNTNTVISQKDNSFIGNNILGKIVLGFPDTLTLDNLSDNIFKKREYYGPVRIKKLQISLLNKYGHPIDLLNNNYSISLEFNILYS